MFLKKQQVQHRNNPTYQSWPRAWLHWFYIDTCAFLIELWSPVSTHSTPSTSPPPVAAAADGPGDYFTRLLVLRSWIVVICASGIVFLADWNVRDSGHAFFTVLPLVLTALVLFKHGVHTLTTVFTYYVGTRQMRGIGWALLHGLHATVSGLLPGRIYAN